MGKGKHKQNMRENMRQTRGKKGLNHNDVTGGCAPSKSKKGKEKKIESTVSQNISVNVSLSPPSPPIVQNLKLS